jgi:hypothetical protein
MVVMTSLKLLTNLASYVLERCYLDSLHDQEGRQKEVKEESRAGCREASEFVSYEDVPDSNCDHEDIGDTRILGACN